MGLDKVRVLYLGVFRDGTGWSAMAINSIMALIAGGADVVARHVKLNDARVDLPEPVLQAERASNGGRFDVVVQNVLPHMYDFCGKIPLNVAYYCTETSRFDGTNWPEKINTLDRAWVCNSQSMLASWNSGVTVPISTIPIACDISKYQRRYKPLSIRDRLGDSFIFYYVGDFNKRKNLVALLKAFHLEFDVNEPVNLVIKTDIGSGAANEFNAVKNREAVTREINKVKEEMKLYRSLDQYKQEVVLVGHYSDEEIMRLHASCDCFVCPSYGEAWCLPAFDAMAMGRTPIVTGHTGFVDYLSNNTGWLVDYRKEPVWGMTNTPFHDLFTSREQWGAVDVLHLMKSMREAYENRSLRSDKASAGRARAYDFSYDKVGRRMIECLKT